MSIFRFKSAKIYTGQKKFTQVYSWLSWQIWGMNSMSGDCRMHPQSKKNHRKNNHEIFIHVFDIYFPQIYLLSTEFGYNTSSLMWWGQWWQVRQRWWWQWLLGVGDVGDDGVDYNDDGHNNVCDEDCYVLVVMMMTLMISMTFRCWRAS